MRMVPVFNFFAYVLRNHNHQMTINQSCKLESPSDCMKASMMGHKAWARGVILTVIVQWFPLSNLTHRSTSNSSWFKGDGDFTPDVAFALMTHWTSAATLLLLLSTWKPFGEAPEVPTIRKTNPQRCQLHKRLNFWHLLNIISMTSFSQEKAFFFHLFFLNSQKKGQW